MIKERLVEIVIEKTLEIRELNEKFMLKNLMNVTNPYNNFGDVIQKVVKSPEPMSRVITEGLAGSCPKCGSTEVRKYGFFDKKIGCIQPECENY